MSLPPGEGPWRRPQASNPSHRPSRRRRIGAALLAVGCVGFGLWAAARLSTGRSLSGQEWAELSYRLGFVALVSASLAARGLELGQSIRFGLIWLAVAGVLLLGFSFRDELGFMAGRVRSELAPAYGVETGPREMSVTAEGDGNFYIMGAVNGRAVRFMIDTGASDTVLSQADAQRIGVNLGELQYTDVYETANGMGRGARFKADSLSVGPVRLSEVDLSINQAPMRSSLLGLSFLKELESFEVRGRRLFMRWRD